MRVRPLTPALLVAAFIGLLPQPAYGQSTPDDLEEERARARSRLTRFTLELRSSGIFDSNLDHDETELDSYGASNIARARLRMRPFTFEYQAGLDRFSRTEKWDRMTHRFAAEGHRSISEWRAGARFEATKGESSDDREPLGATYLIEPELEYTIDVDSRVSFLGRYQIRHFGGEESRQDRTWLTGAEYKRQSGSAQWWSVRYRYEAANTSVTRNRYRRHTWLAYSRTKVTPNDELLLGVSFFTRRYPNRLIEIEIGPEGEDEYEELRHDTRWTYRISWAHTMSNALRLEAAYALDRQNSNDEDKLFRAHRFGLSMTWYVR